MTTNPSATPPTEGPGDLAGPASATGTSIGLDPKVGGLLAYLFGWVSGLILFLVEKEHREVRFHAAQSLLLSIVFIGAYVLLSVLAMVPVIGLLALVGYLAVGLGGFVLWVFMLIKGYNLDHVRLPVIGTIAEQWAAK